MSGEQTEMEQLSELIAATRSLLLAEKSRGVNYLPVSSPELLRAAQSQPMGDRQRQERRPPASNKRLQVKADAPASKKQTVKEAKVDPAIYASLSPALQEVFAESQGCVKCPLSQGRKSVVFGVGPNDADLLIVGEAPGAIEDVRSEPFVGPIGEMLNKMLVNVVGLSRAQVYLVNAVKCKVKGGKSPKSDEIEQCRGYLERQIAAISPKLILCLGEGATKALVSSEETVEGLRGRWHEYNGVPVLVSYNPAFLLKHPKFKRPVFNDLKLVAAKYDELGGAR